MAHGIGTYLGNAWMNALGNATSFSVTMPYVKLHVGDPGAAVQRTLLWKPHAKQFHLVFPLLVR